MPRLAVGVVGASGYMGGELLRYLRNHLRMEVEVIVAGERAGHDAAEVLPNLTWLKGRTLAELRLDDLRGLDLVFLSLPHGQSGLLVPELTAQGVAVVDLAGDFRLKEPALYPVWYGFDHPAPGLLGSAVYGLPELYRKELEGARLVANPGCYATAILLALAPLGPRLEGRRVAVSAASGSSGAGRRAEPHLTLSHLEENFFPYRVGRHQHVPEVLQVLGEKVGAVGGLSFVPHLAPMARGIVATCIVDPAPEEEEDELREVYTDFYSSSPFVEVLPAGRWPEAKWVRGTNRAQVGLGRDPAGTLVVVVALDNLGKGGAGQAIQNANLALGLEEAEGLELEGLYP